ncbi:MAG: hypothetical protein ABSA46_14035 [Thermodesulfovibrionales bacterium]
MWCYRAAWNSFREGKLSAYQSHTGTVIIREDSQPAQGRVAVNSATQLRRYERTGRPRRRSPGLGRRRFSVLSILTADRGL